MRRAIPLAAILSVVCHAAIPQSAQAQFTVLHTFTGTYDDGGEPYGSLIQSGSTLYGMTNKGGSNSSGTIFKIGVDGASFSLLHSFDGAFESGHPFGSLIQSGSTLYGMNNSGETFPPRGTIF